MSLIEIGYCCAILNFTDNIYYHYFYFYLFKFILKYLYYSLCLTPFHLKLLYLFKYINSNMIYHSFNLRLI